MASQVDLTFLDSLSNPLGLSTSSDPWLAPSDDFSMQSPSAFALNLGDGQLFEESMFDTQFPASVTPTKWEPPASLGKFPSQPLALPLITKYALSDDESDSDDVDSMAGDAIKLEPQPQRTGGKGRLVKPPPRAQKRKASESHSAESDSDVETLLNSLPKSKAGRKKKHVTSNMTKNALAARENRERKKKYIEDLEATVRALNAENKALKKQQQGDHQKITSLTQAIKYYTSVISNIDEIRGLVQKVATNPMNTPPADHDYGQQELDQPGVCLHVAGTKMALKVCAKCSLSEDPVL